MMSEKGKLVRWFDDKGFGFIKPENGQRDIFIHMSAITNRSRQPIVGDVIYYQVSMDDQGKPRAVNAKIDGVMSINENPSSWSLTPLVKKVEAKRAASEEVNNSRKVNHKASRPQKHFNLIPVLFLMGSGFLIYSLVTQDKVIANNVLEPVSSGIKPIEPQYQCQGKIYCSQMTSCDEATFYLNNCPSTKMDGDHDGVPCESQWCG